jgi:hypothetical protein
MLRARPGLPHNRTAGWAGRVEPSRRQAVDSPAPTGGWIYGDSGERTLAQPRLLSHESADGLPLPRVCRWAERAVEDGNRVPSDRHSVAIQLNTDQS